MYSNPLFFSFSNLFCTLFLFRLNILRGYKLCFSACCNLSLFLLLFDICNSLQPANNLLILELLLAFLANRFELVTDRLCDLLLFLCEVHYLVIKLLLLHFFLQYPEHLFLVPYVQHLLQNLYLRFLVPFFFVNPQQLLKLSWLIPSLGNPQYLSKGIHLNILILFIIITFIIGRFVAAYFTIA